jgi:hypothetical protein
LWAEYLFLGETTLIGAYVTADWLFWLFTKLLLNDNNDTESIARNYLDLSLKDRNRNIQEDQMLKSTHTGTAQPE